MDLKHLMSSTGEVSVLQMKGPKFNSFASAIPIMIFLPPEVKERPFPFWKVVGEEGFEPPTPWFVATCSNPLSYRPHPVSTGSVPGSTLKKEPFLSSAISG